MKAPVRKYMWPDEDTLKRMRRKLARGPASRAMPENPTPIERAKYALCAEFIRYIREQEINQRQLAKLINASESRVSEIVHYHIDKLTIGQLLRYWSQIKPNFKLTVTG